MILKLLIIIAVVTIAIVIVKGRIKPKRVLIPFKESMDLVHLPIVTFINNGVRLHFILDTGADDSYISEEILPSLVIKDQQPLCSHSVTGMNSAASAGSLVTLDLSYKSEVFETPALVMKFHNMFEQGHIKGIEIHGVLGSIFFEKHKYHLDFANYEAYPK